MDEYTKQLIESARATYKDVVAGNDSRIQRGKVLWDQFEAAADACRIGGMDSERQLGERINELAVERMETQIKELRTTLKSLAEDKVFDELSRIIRRPGFTRPAEAAFLVGLLDSMLGQAKNMSRLKQVVLAGAEKVELNPQPLPP